MKKTVSKFLVVLCVLCGFASESFASDIDILRPETDGFRRLIWTSWGLGVGHSNVRGLGLSVSGQGMFQLNSKFALGLESGAFVRMWAAPESDAISVEQFVQVPQHFKVEFRPGKGRARPFFGLGLGRQYIVGQWITTSNSEESSGANITQIAGQFFGGSAEVGLELGRFRMSLKYTYANGSDVYAAQSIGVSSSEDMSNVGVSQSVGDSPLLAHYLSFELGAIRPIVLIRPSEGSVWDKLN